jgi:hypothetical protein
MKSQASNVIDLEAFRQKKQRERSPEMLSASVAAPMFVPVWICWVPVWTPMVP